jgi:hypothetical protein
MKNLIIRCCVFFCSCCIIVFTGLLLLGAFVPMGRWQTLGGMVLGGVSFIGSMRIVIFVEDNYL